MTHSPQRMAAVLGLALLLTGLTGLATPAAAGQGPPMNRIYAHDELFTGVNTPRDLPNRGAFDTIYVLGSGLASVADAGPGDPDFNGGRWEVHFVTWVSGSPEQFTNAEQVKAAEAAGRIQIGDVARRFECPMVPLRGAH